jgi:hypothetical protein
VRTQQAVGIILALLAPIIAGPGEELRLDGDPATATRTRRWGTPRVVLPRPRRRAFVRLGRLGLVATCAVRLWCDAKPVPLLEFLGDASAGAFVELRPKRCRERLLTTIRCDKHGIRADPRRCGPPTTVVGLSRSGCRSSRGAPVSHVRRLSTTLRVLR